RDRAEGRRQRLHRHRQLGLVAQAHAYVGVDEDTRLLGTEAQPGPEYDGERQRILGRGRRLERTARRVVRYVANGAIRDVLVDTHRHMERPVIDLDDATDGNFVATIVDESDPHTSFDRHHRLQHQSAIFALDDRAHRRTNGNLRGHTGRLPRHHT